MQASIMDRGPRFVHARPTGLLMDRGGVETKSSAPVSAWLLGPGHHQERVRSIWLFTALRMKWSEAESIPSSSNSESEEEREGS